jgi:cytochrome c biogenesis protein CcmG/thiol:disulfide interchange protein DsbE
MTSQSDSDPREASAPNADEGGGRGLALKRALFLLPVAVFLAIASWFAWGLLADRDPSEVPSALIDKPVPQFNLGPIPGLDVPGLSRADLAETQQPILLNVFASWCQPCRAEHPIMMRLAERDGVKIYGVNYKDQPQDAKQWLANLGNPYARIGQDLDGRAGIQLGVYGVPETYVIGPSGLIRYKHVGPITPKALREDILPLLDKLRQG